MTINREMIENRFREIQDIICKAIEKEDGKEKFIEDAWQRDGGGGGHSRVLQLGNVIEKGGVNFSAVYGELPATMQKALGVNSPEFYATGVSIVMHPISPMVPIIHMNIRYFEIPNGPSWFGGGIDLTPHYVNKEQASYFHKKLKAVCDKYNSAFYEKYKAEADDYFFIKHRNETRGVGGIFFDRIEPSEEMPKEKVFDFCCDLGLLFAELYPHFMQINKAISFDDAQVKWQMQRRSRYVEFNLVYDKGTRFGLETNGRIESILMSLPLKTGWEYNPQVQPNSEEATTLELLKKGINWVEMSF